MSDHTTIRVRAKSNCQIVTGRESGSGKPLRPMPGEWFTIPAKELGNIAIAAQVETEEQAAASDLAATTAAAAGVQGGPREDPEFMRMRTMFRTQAETAAAEVEATQAEQGKENETRAAERAATAPEPRRQHHGGKRGGGKAEG